MVPEGPGPAPRPPASCLPHLSSYVLRQHAACLCGTESPGPASLNYAQTTPPAGFGPRPRFRVLGRKRLGLGTGQVASVLGCEGHFLPGGDQVLKKPSHPVQPPAPNGVQALVTSLGGSREPATPPLPSAVSSLPLAHWEDSWLCSRPGHLRAGAAPDVPDRLEQSTLA